MFYGINEKNRKMWLGREIGVVGLPPFMKLGRARDTPRLVSPCRDDTFISLESKSNLAPTTNTLHPTLYICTTPLSFIIGTTNREGGGGGEYEFHKS